MKKKRLTNLLLTGFILTAPGICFGSSIEDQASKIHRKYSEAVITVKLVTRQRMIVAGKEMDKGEQKREASGVVIDPSGLAIVSLFVTDPWAKTSFAMGGDDDPDFSWETEITDVKMLMADGNEIQASVLLRDRDLDLVFIRPDQQPKSPFTFIDFSKSTKAKILQNMVFLGRLSKAAGRESSVTISRVKAIVQKPRLYYIPDGTALLNGLGRPAFAENGKTIGILLMRVMPSRSGEFNETPFILPASDIVDVMKQVPEIE